MGGDGSDVAPAWVTNVGSPPRGRGRPRSVESGGSASRAHPRVGGDGQDALLDGAAFEGSPPRGRGRPMAGMTPARSPGLTPAWAGTACRLRPRRAAGGAHPRVGGDGWSQRRSVDQAMGSPPRGRGRRAGLPSRQQGAGLTPAWAGTAGRPTMCALRARAHPRVGGDGQLGATTLNRKWGSPPRGRGRLRHDRPRLRPRGLTPAWAGTAKSTRLGVSPCRAHPRVGGDGGFHLGGQGGSEGSPPRGRGRLRL